MSKLSTASELILNQNSVSQPASYPIGSYPGLKRPERKDNHPLASSAEIKNAWSYTSNPPSCFDVTVLS